MVIIVVALLVDAAVAPAVQSAATTEENPPYVAVASLDRPIFGSSADATIEELREVRENDSIEARVHQVDSPGGAASASEAQYMAVKRLAAEKPVVTAVRGMVASGMYYTNLLTESIFPTPPSSGTWVSGHPFRQGLASPANLRRGRTTSPTTRRRRPWHESRLRKNAFIGTVINERGDRI